MGTYKIVYRDAAGNDRKAFTTFEDKSTIEENLARIVPKAVERGLLHPEATAQNVLVEHKGARLNLKVPIQQAAPGIQKDDEIVVRYLASSVTLRLKFNADDPDDQRKIYFGKRKTVKIREPVAVSPSEPLTGQIEEKLDEIRGKHRFFGKEVKDAKAFKLRANQKKVNPKLSLAEQGFEADLDVKVKPQVWFDWPPLFFHGLRGPYTAYAITLAVVLAFVALFFLIFSTQEVPYFRVTFEAPYDCNIKVDRSDTFVPNHDGKPTETLKAGTHAVHVYPRERPVWEHNLHLRKTVRGDISESDSMWTVVLPAGPADSTAARRTPVKVVGYVGETDLRNLRVPMFLNGFEYHVDDDLGIDFNLLPGKYEIKFDVDDDRFISSNTSADGVKKESEYVFVVKDSIQTTITFLYREKGGS